MEVSIVSPLGGDDLKKWLEVTQVQLVDEIKTRMNPPVVMVNVSVVSQNPPFEKTRRGLRQKQKNHEIVFNADYEIQVAQQITNIDSFVTGAFVSDYKRKVYIERLKAVGGSVFANVSEVVVESLSNGESSGNEPQEDGNTDNPAGDETSPAGGGISIGIVVGIVMLFIVVLILGSACYVRCKRREPRKKTKKPVAEVVTGVKPDPKGPRPDGTGTSEAGASLNDGSVYKYTSDGEEKDAPNYVPWYNMALDPPSYQSDVESISVCSKTSVKSSWFKLSRGPTSDRSDNGNSIDSTGGPNYTSWYSGFSLRSIARSEVSHNSNNSGNTIETKSSNSSTGEYTVTVPKGKLGMLLDDSDGNEQYPKVQTIKPGSPFEGQVKGGDFLLRIDGQDLKGVKLEVISHILAYKKNNDSRAFTFVRPQAEK